MMRFYAEDVAIMFELVECCVSITTIGELFRVTPEVVNNVIDGAKRSGFDLYPLRNKDA